MKRHNPYCAKDVAKKYNISYEEANFRVQDLKNRTTITLENLIRKHGEEEGKKRFDQFRQKSAHTKEKYQQKYGDQWEEHWKKYLQSKSCSLEKFIERYGKEGARLYEEYQLKKSYSNSLECYVEKYGPKEGMEKYNLIQKKRCTSELSSFVEKFGPEEGVKRYRETNAKKDSSSLNFFVTKYGEEKGRQEYENKKMRSSPLFCALKKEYGEKTALEAYLDCKKKRFDEVCNNFELVSSYKTKIKKDKLSKGPVSKESSKFFKMLETLLGRKLAFGLKKDELKLINIETMRYFCYDCYDTESNTIVEFHGVAWHPKEGELDWQNPFGLSYNEKMQEDLKKKQLAESKGYSYVVIYSDEVRTVDKRKEKLHFLKEVIHAYCEKNQKS